MAEPASLEEYQQRFNANAFVDGHGLDTAQHVPCPFCGAPGFATWYVAAGIAPGDDRPTVREQMQETRTCAECGRSLRADVKGSLEAPGGVEFEFVQTGGPDPPAWLVPAPRRA